MGGLLCTFIWHKLQNYFLSLELKFLRFGPQHAFWFEFSAFSNSSFWFLQCHTLTLLQDMAFPCSGPGVSFTWTFTCHRFKITIMIAMPWFWNFICCCTFYPSKDFSTVNWTRTAHKGYKTASYMMMMMYFSFLYSHPPLLGHTLTTSHPNYLTWNELSA